MKPTLHLVSGWSYPPTLLEPLAMQLADVADVTTHAFDLPLTQLAKTPRPWWLAGWSLGGLRALEAVCHGQLQPDGLILISSTARFCATDDYPHGIPRARLRAMIRNLPREPANVLQTFHALAGIHAPAQHDLQSLRLGLTWLDTLDMRDQLGDVPCPVFIAHGVKDPIIPVTAAHYLAERLPNAHLHLHADATHALPASHAPWLAERLRARLS